MYNNISNIILTIKRVCNMNFTYPHNGIFLSLIHDENILCAMSVLRGGKLHPSNAAVLKLLVLLANSASKVPCQWVIERNGSYRLISCIYNRRSRISKSVVFFSRDYLHSGAASAFSSERRRARELLRSGTFSGLPSVDQGRRSNATSIKCRALKE